MILSLYVMLEGLVTILGLFVAIVALFSLFLGEELGFALGANVLGAISFVLMGLLLFVFGIHTHRSCLLLCGL